MTWLLAHRPPPASEQWCSARAKVIVSPFSTHAPHVCVNAPVFPYAQRVAWQHESACTMNSVSFTSLWNARHGGVAHVSHVSRMVGMTSGR